MTPEIKAKIEEANRSMIDPNLTIEQYRQLVTDSSKWLEKLEKIREEVNALAKEEPRGMRNHYTEGKDFAYSQILSIIDKHIKQ